MNTPLTDSEITFTGVYTCTCTHHTDSERIACPVCLVTALTAERDRLRSRCDQLIESQRLAESAMLEQFARADKAKAELSLALAACRAVLFAAKQAQRYRGEYSLPDLCAAEKLARAAIDASVKEGA